MAIEMALRSDDSNTKCGCILVDSSNTIISTGFNGFVRGIEPKNLPNVRCENNYKNQFMIHAEHNAILNCTRQGKSTINSTSYQTGYPCNWCLQYMAQAGITKIVWTNWSKPKMNEEELALKIEDVLARLVVDRIIQFEFVDSKILRGMDK